MSGGQIHFQLNIPADLQPGSYVFNVAVKIENNSLVSISSLDSVKIPPVTLPSTPPRKTFRVPTGMVDSSPTEPSDADSPENLRKHVRYEEEESSSDREREKSLDAESVTTTTGRLSEPPSKRAKSLSESPSSFLLRRPGPHLDPAREEVRKRLARDMTRRQDEYYRAIEDGELVPDSEGEDLAALLISTDPTALRGNVATFNHEFKEFFEMCNVSPLRHTYLNSSI